MDKKLISCAFNIDTARVEVKYADDIFMCGCGWADDLYRRHGSLLKMENAGACQAAA